MNYGRGLGPNGFPTREQILDPYYFPREVIGECWIYLGAIADGYGKKKIHGRMYGVHRIVAHVFHGLDINNPEQLACHLNICTNTACFRPEHIYVGDRGTNLVDAYIKGTMVSPWIGRTYNSHIK